MDSDVGSDNYDFGARIYDARIGRWMAEDPLTSKFSSETPFNFAGNSPVSFIDIDGNEKIIVCGGNKNAGAGSKLMFAEQGLRQLKSYSSSTENKTVILVNINNAYTQEQINQISLDVSANGGQLITVTSTDDLNIYINNKKTSTFTPMVNGIVQNRVDDKISSIDFFSPWYL